MWKGQYSFQMQPSSSTPPALIDHTKEAWALRARFSTFPLCYSRLAGLLWAHCFLPDLRNRLWKKDTVFLNYWRCSNCSAGLENGEQKIKESANLLRKKKKKGRCWRVSDASKKEQERTVGAVTTGAPVISKRLLLSSGIQFSHHKDIIMFSQRFLFFLKKRLN